ncbi:hypothetical protein CEXT_378931 [Caerostris extrusa]|uniref:Uncharacterized protein n=1 Tax=Caerostris extrusa TaxID=172846 RepID=A0AAV4QW37_CAEEX|nr:hypothetical protein CEXT_378931 [Caerostris extrusa]
MRWPLLEKHSKASKAKEEDVNQSKRNFGAQGEISVAHAAGIRFCTLKENSATPPAFLYYAREPSEIQKD